MVRAREDEDSLAEPEGDTGVSLRNKKDVRKGKK